MILAFLRRATPAAVVLAAVAWAACSESADITGPSASGLPRLTEDATASFTWAIPETDPEIMVTMTRLGELVDGGFSRALGISDDGVVVGDAEADPERLAAFYWTADVGTMQKIFAPGWTRTAALDVNDNFFVVGFGTFEGVSIGFRWDQSKPEMMERLLGIDGATAKANVAYMDNTALGSARDGSEPRAVQWPPGLSGAHRSFGEGATIQGANDSGDLVGAVKGQKAFLWKRFPVIGFLEEIPIPHLGSAPEGQAEDVNSSSHVVGWVRSPLRAFMWDGTTQPLFGLADDDAQAFGISDNIEGDLNDELIVGESKVADGTKHATLWKNRTPLDLQPPAGKLSELIVSSHARAINNSRLIAGYLRVEREGVRRNIAVVWTLGDGEEPETAEEVLALLKEEIAALQDEGVLNKGQANSLTKKIDGALDKIEDGKIKTAINKLEAFINEVEAFVNGGTFMDEQGQALIDLAQAAIDLLNAT